jgi:V/A-type H+-transporting ATPase subunit I
LLVVKREVVLALARMKRVFIVGLGDDREKVVRFLQEAGVLHVEPSAKLSGEAEKQNTLIVQDVRRVGQIYESMKSYGKSKQKGTADCSDDEIISKCEKALESLQEVKNRKQTLEKNIADLSIWGDFDTEYVLALERDGVFVQRFRAEGILPSELNIPDDVFMEVVSDKPSLQFITVRLGHPVELPWAAPLRLPEEGLQKAKEEIALLMERESQIVHELFLLAERIDIIKKQYLDRLSEADFTECLGTLYSEGFLFGLQGWAPADIENVFLNQIATSELAILVKMRDPLEDETPPTLFKNNWFFKRIEPLLKLYGSPGYRDLDPSYFFAPFMILFFGICLGDAGYGAVFLLASIFIRKRFGHLSPSLPVVMRLCEAFSISAIVIGILTGSVFGHWVFTREWIVVDLDQQHGDPMILFYASLGLGVIHLSTSYLMGVLQSSSRIVQFQKLGLLGVLWGGSCLISQRIWFTDSSAVLHNWLFYGGIGFLACGLLLTFLFASDSKRLLVRFGLGLWNIYGLTGLVGDLLSYARLFGLGIATTAIAAVMNDLAGMVHQAAGSVIGAILGVLVLVLGHTFNLLLSILGSTVHSARLHFVEAFKSFFQGGGIEYKPFKVERG